GGEVAVPEVGHGNRLLDEGHLGRRRVLRRLVRCRLLGDEEHIVGAGRDGERSGDTQWVLSGGHRHETDVLVGVIRLLALVVLLPCLLLVPPPARLRGGPARPPRQVWPRPPRHPASRTPPCRPSPSTDRR